MIKDNNLSSSSSKATVTKEKLSSSKSETAKTEEKTTPAETEIAAAAGQLYLLSAVAQDEEALKELEQHLEGKGKLVKAESLGKKMLAYPINKHNELFLLSVFFTAEPSAIAAFEKELKTEDAIERYLVTTWRGDLNKPETSRHAKMFRKTTIQERVAV